jgi:multiple antibiotic resistance protein
MDIPWFHVILATCVALLPIANPFSTAAVFLGMTKGDTPAERNRQALMGCVYMFFILVSFLIAGTLVMRFFGISIPGLRIAGGLMIARIALGMLRPTADNEQLPDERGRAEARRKADISFTPLAMPSLSGPGAIAVTIGMASEVTYWGQYIAITLGILIVSVICFAVLRASTQVVRFLGENGMNALTRIMGFLLLCVGVQFIVNGVVGIVVEEQFLRALAVAYQAAASQP